VAPPLEALLVGWISPVDLHAPLGSQLLPADVPFLLVHLASLPHPIRLQIAERARSLALRLDASKVLQPDIVSFFVLWASQRQVLLLVAPISTGVAPIMSAYAFVLHVYIARLLVLAAVKRNVVVLAAENRKNLAALVLACLVNQVNMVSVLVL
jgi:hypothetical protein